MAFDIQFKLIYQGIRDVFRVRSLSQMDQGDFGAMLLRNMPFNDGGQGNGGGNGKGRTPEEAAKGFSQEYGDAKKNNFQSNEKNFMTEKAKSATAGAAGGAVGGKAGAAAGTAAGDPVGGVVGGLAGSAVGDAAGSAAYDASKSKENGTNSSGAQNSENGNTPTARTPEEGAQNFTNQYNAAKANGFQPHGGDKGTNGKDGKKDIDKK